MIIWLIDRSIDLLILGIFDYGYDHYRKTVRSPWFLTVHHNLSGPQFRSHILSAFRWHTSSHQHYFKLFFFVTSASSGHSSSTSFNVWPLHLLFQNWYVIGWLTVCLLITWTSWYASVVVLSAFYTLLAWLLVIIWVTRDLNTDSNSSLSSLYIFCCHFPNHIVILKLFWSLNIPFFHECLQLELCHLPLENYFARFLLIFLETSGFNISGKPFS